MKSFIIICTLSLFSLALISGCANQGQKTKGQPYSKKLKQNYRQSGGQQGGDVGGVEPQQDQLESAF